jgi:hypothetical protein
MRLLKLLTVAKLDDSHMNGHYTSWKPVFAFGFFNLLCLPFGIELGSVPFPLKPRELVKNLLVISIASLS